MHVYLGKHYREVLYFADRGRDSREVGMHVQLACRYIHARAYRSNSWYTHIHNIIQTLIFNECVRIMDGT